MSQKPPLSRWMLPLIAVNMVMTYLALPLAYDWLESNGHPPGTIAVVLVGSFVAVLAAALLVWLLARRRFHIVYALLGAHTAFPITWLVVALANGQRWHHSILFFVIMLTPLLAILLVLGLLQGRLTRKPDGEVPRPRPKAKSWSRRG